LGKKIPENFQTKTFSSKMLFVFKFIILSRKKFFQSEFREEEKNSIFLFGFYFDKNIFPKNFFALFDFSKKIENVSISIRENFCERKYKKILRQNFFPQKILLEIFISP